MCKLQCVEICTLLKKSWLDLVIFWVKIDKTLIGHRKLTKYSHDFFYKV